MTLRAVGPGFETRQEQTTGTYLRFQYLCPTGVKCSSVLLYCSSVIGRAMNQMSLVRIQAYENQQH